MRKSFCLLQKEPDLHCLGKGSFDYVKGGGGSGDVAVSYVHNLYDGFKMQGNAVMLYEPLAEFYRENVRGNSIGKVQCQV